MAADASSIEKEMTTKDKVISLYKYIEEFSAAKQKKILNYEEHHWSKSLDYIQENYPHVEINYRDHIESENGEILEFNPILLQLKKPALFACPKPDKSIEPWIKEDWRDYRQEKITHLDRIEHVNKDKKIVRVEHFAEDPKRKDMFNQWADYWKKWAQEQRNILKEQAFFTELHSLHIELDKNSETMELVIASGLLTDKNDRTIKHPLLTRRVTTYFDAESNTISIIDTDTPSELYTVLFQAMSEINLDRMPDIINELEKADYHPADRIDTPDFFKALIHQLSPDGDFIGQNLKEDLSKSRLLIKLNPMFILRKRMDGTIKTVRQIIENIEETDFIPSHIKEIVAGGKIQVPSETKEKSIQEYLAEVGGENFDIYLSKQANKEQLEIAKRIEQYNAVLVQGPPGTGKTHTIANLLGHFLAQGKSVLVTSHTKKALSVLKEKVPPALQNLCVSILDDSNKDMESSIDGISSYMTHFNSHELKKEMELIGQERAQVINDLAETRKRLFSIIHQECNSIVFDGEGLSPSKIAQFVVNNAEELDYIPGTVALKKPLPLSFEELSELYQSNENITTNDEAELINQLPSPDKVIAPEDFKKLCDDLATEKDFLEKLQEKTQWEISNNKSENQLHLKNTQQSLSISLPKTQDLTDLESFLEKIGPFDEWMIHAAVDGRKGGNYLKCWEVLIKSIEETSAAAEKCYTSSFGKEIKFNSDIPSNERIDLIHKLKEHFDKKDHISKLDLLFHGVLKKALTTASINGNPISSKEDCEILIEHFELEEKRKQCARFWDDLLKKHQVDDFFSLDKESPEQVAQRFIPLIQYYLSWFQKDYITLINHLGNNGISHEQLFAKSITDSEADETRKIFRIITETLPNILIACQSAIKINQLEDKLLEATSVLKKENLSKSKLCMDLLQSMKKLDPNNYEVIYKNLCETYRKYDLQLKREEALAKISTVAPQWADEIRRRQGIHGKNAVPYNIEQAWKWKQYSAILQEITKEPFADLQEKSLSLSRRYRDITAQYAEKCAWYKLLQRTEHDIDIRQSLQGWKQTIKKIGKGTGKNAPRYRAEAKRLMAKCQTAVPAWIMPISRALETLNPKTNRFDVIIVDEASQADISALAIAYLADKIIIVGDDKQVSPMAVGIRIEKMNALENIYIKDIIPNSHLYSATTSLYDIAATTFQPLMLREHFRCVPDIIGFSNSLSYNFKIKPLRDASTTEVTPSVVNYRVDGRRNLSRKENYKEALTIVALIKACLEQPEYEGKTFGVISMLGDDQANIIQNYILNYIDPREIERRRIICGNASNFQGDERDIIFLSLVDSSKGTGPISLMREGKDDSNKKRYNVATSRAKDQLWVVHSLDPAVDLKPDDIRKNLIEYAMDPEAFKQKVEQVEQLSESPFESAVARTLVSRGYHIEQQKEVGSYRLDMVAEYNHKYVAIECDGERYHSGEAKIREDMERQTILERIGWRFIRIRGSEYYKDPEKAMERVFGELKNFGIYPESKSVQQNEELHSDLLKKVKIRALEMTEKIGFNDNLPDFETIEAALSAE